MSAPHDRVVLFFLRDGTDGREVRDSISVAHGAVPGVGERILIGADKWIIMRREWEFPGQDGPWTPMRVHLYLAPRKS